MTDLKSFFGSLRDVIIVHQCTSGDIIYVNDKGRKIYGHPIKDYKKNGISLILKNTDSKKYQSALNKVIKTGKPEILTNVLIAEFNADILADITFNKLEVNDQKYVIVTIQHKTEETRELISSINKNISDGIYRSYPSGSFVYVNDAFVRMFSYSSIEDVLQIDPSKLYANPKDRDEVNRRLKKDGKISNHEVLLRKKDGSTFWGSMSSNLTKDSKGNEIYDGALRDITEFKLAQTQVLENQQLLESINKNISEGIYRSYAKGGLIYVNESFAKMFGYKSAKEILAVPSLNLYANPTDRKGLTPQIQKIGFKTNLETLFKRRDGSTFWGLNSYILTKDQHGNSVFDGAVRDIHEQKLAEEKLKKLNDELVERNNDLALKERELQSSNEELIANSQNLVRTLDELSERNFELDQLIYRTSHDLRSPLRSVLGLTNLMKVEREELSPEYLAKIEERILRMDDFIKAMLEYSRTSRLGIVYKEINLESMINDCISDLEYLEGFDEMNISIDYNNQRKVINSDELRVKIIFGNIISNAYKYRSTERKVSYLKILIDIQNDWVDVQFKDNGIGISKQFQDKIFDMFFRATEKSDGSGLGMYLVKQSVDKLGGKIKLVSTENKSTTIKIRLPNKA